VTRRLGLMGGAFDPPHLGHRALAQCAMEQLQLDALYIVPTGQAWHKPRALTHPTHRLLMCELAFGDLAGVHIDPRETVREGPSYTIDTMQELRHEQPDSQWHLIIGEDQAFSLPTWRQWERLCELAIICVAARADNSGAIGQFDALRALCPGLQQLAMPPLSVSATQIRQCVAQHESIAPLVFAPVARYIAHHHLYQSA
jgi:nicotinate-nucleotide adenylyltransferase